MNFFTRKTPPWAVTLTALVVETLKEIGKLMAAVQVDQSILDNASDAIESLVTEVGTSNTTTEALVAAVTAFLANPQVQQIPEGVTGPLAQAVTDAGTAQTSLAQAVTDAGTAQAALQNATPPAPSS